jgi:prepilin-type N-terminal cleavage/methylation domain-containing protein
MFTANNNSVRWTMNCRFETAWRAGKRHLRGMTLVEVMLAVGIGSLLMAALASITLFTAQSFVALGNYDDLDRYSRNALDVMSRAIRDSQGVTAYQTNSLTLLDDAGNPITFNWDTADTVTFTRDGVTTVLLTNCDFLRFGIYQRNPSNNFSFYPTNSLSEAKLVDVSWRCSRQIRGQKLNTESVQTAKIVIRN